MNLATLLRGRAALALGLLSTLFACTEVDKVTFGQRLEGDACGQVSDCLAGLDCVEGFCAPLPPLVEGPQRGDVCDDDNDCFPDLVCGRQNVCTASEGGVAGAPCGLTEDCQDPLICHGHAGECSLDDGSAGTYDLGETCDELLDCRRPLICGLDKKCSKLPIYLGPTCPRSDADAGLFRVFFELPPAEVPADYEFYRLPFPSDIRRDAAGHIQLAGHAAPPPALGVDMRELYFGAVEEDVVGFAPNQPVFFRFSDLLDHTSVCLDDGSLYPEVPLTDPPTPAYCGSGGDATVYLVNVDPDSPRYNERIPVQLDQDRESNLYICQNWLGIAPLDGRPLEQGVTYAAVITTGIRDVRGDAPIHDGDFAALLSGGVSVPAMAPFLEWLADQNIASSSIAAATVFTVGVPALTAKRIRDGVQAVSTTPTFGAHVLCDGVNVSPCAAASAPEPRGCTVVGGNFDVLEGTYPAPYFQQGTRPYLLSGDGGAFELDGNGIPQAQGTENMCFAVAVPQGVPPPSGYPVVIYSHGTGGSFESFLSEGASDGRSVAEILTSLGYAVIGIDNVMHGPRQQQPGTPPVPTLWNSDPGSLFFNLGNPRASRDNISQGAADLFWLTRLLGTASATLTHPSGTVRFRADRIHFIGHSQGTIISPAYLAAEPNVRAAVLSGAGAELALSILNKQEPSDIGLAAAIFFGDQTLSRVHPMMGILAMVFAETDSITYAHHWVTTPLAPRTGPLPLLQFTGVGDSFAPDIAQHAQIRAAGLPIVGDVEVPIEGVTSIPSPAQNNLNGVTAGAVQYAPAQGDDGHFVMFDAPGQVTLDAFFDSALTGAPSIVK